MKKYKVWLQIEEIDDDADHYEDVGEPMPLMDFNTIEDAEKFLKTLHWEWRGE